MPAAKQRPNAFVALFYYALLTHKRIQTFAPLRLRRAAAGLPDSVRKPARRQAVKIALRAILAYAPPYSK